MATGFDPYHRWLSIPPSEQPPHHYRLLGLREFESEVEVIENAAARQITHVHPHLQSPLRPYATNLIRELDVARKCLLDPEAKNAYDAWLAQCVSRKTTEHAVRLSQSFPQRDSAESVRRSPSSDSVIVPAVVAASRLRRRKSKIAPIALLTMWFAGGAIGLLAGYAILCLLDPQYDFLHVMFRHEPPLLATNTAPLSPLSVTPQQQSPTQKSTAPSRSARVHMPPKAKVKIAREPEQVELNHRIASANPTPRAREPLANRVTRLNVPDALPLPSLRATDKATLLTALVGEEVVAPNLKEIELSLAQGSNTDAGKLQLAADSSGPENEPSWNVRWIVARADHGNVDDPANPEVGKFSLIKNVLCFAWSADVPRPAYSAMRNSVLQVQLAPQRYYSALRIAERIEPLSIDLQNPKVHVLLKCDEMPELENIRVDIQAETRLPRFTAVGLGLKGLKLNDQTILMYQQAKGASTHFKLSKLGRRPLLEIKTEYELPSGYRDFLTLVGGNITMRRLQQNLVNAKLRQTKARNAAQLNAAASEIKAIQTDLEALTQISVLAAQFNRDVKLPVRFYFSVDGYEIDLAKSDELLD